MIYQFGDCIWDTVRGEMWRAGEAVDVTPQALAVLRYLLEHRDRVVSRRELLAQCWPDTQVSQDALTSCLRRVRQAIGQTQGGPTLIATRHRRGYQFVAEVTERGAPPETASPQGAEPPLTAARIAPPGAEWRQLTVLFCDLVASTQLMNQLDLEDYRDVVRDYQALCADAIAPYTGYIAQYLGDGLLIYFGYPAAHEDDAQCAVWAALDIVAAVDQTFNPRLRRTLGVSIAVRLGIHTGAVIMGAMGDDSHQEQLAVGETPAIASRLQALAAPNTIVVGEATAKLVEGYVTLEALGAHQLRGAAAPMPIFRVLDRTGARLRFDVSARRGVSPLAGRKDELSLLTQRWDQARAGRGQVVVISGEAGIGKSRLALALKEQIAAQAHGRAEWQASPHHPHTPLHPVTDFLRRLLQITPEDTPAEKFAKLERFLEQIGLPVAESAPVVADLLAFPLPPHLQATVELEPPAQRRRTLAMLAALLTQLSARRPLLFVVEDLHWADPSTLEALDMLLAQMVDAPILALFTCRVEFQRLWRSRAELTHLNLARLPRAPMIQMAMSVTRGKTLPPEVLDYIVDQTDGVPLFIEEMTKAIVESPHFAEAGGGASARHLDVRTLIPATLHDSLMSRLDRLGDAKVVAQYASVIGRQFSYELLAVLLPLDVVALQRELSRLRAAQLIERGGGAPQAGFVFSHALIQETAYQSLLRDEKQRLHRQIADWLAARSLDASERIAHHYTAAGDSSKAITHWREAGRAATARFAHEEAASHFEQALALLGAQPETPERDAVELGLQTSLGASLIATKGYASPEVEPVYLRAQALCRGLGHPVRLLQVLFGLQAMYLTRGALREARRLAEECLALAERHPEPPRLPHAHFVLGNTLFFLGDLVLARRHLEAGAALYDPQLHRGGSLNDVGVDCLLYAAGTLWSLGYPDQALTRLQEALDLTQTLASPFNRAHFLACAAAIYLNRGEPHEAQTHADTCRNLSQEQAFPHWLALATALAGAALAAQGQPQEGAELMQRGMRVWRGIGAQQSVTYQLGLLAAVYAKSGRVDDGLQTLAEGLALAEQTDERYHLADLHRLQGDLLLAQSQGKEAEAQASFEQALQIARRQQAKSLELRAAVSLARLWRRQDKSREAHGLLAPVYAWFSEGFGTADLIEARDLLKALEESR